MAGLRSVQRCLWAEPTLFLANPFWMAAEQYPWSCHADGIPRPVEDTAACDACGRWTCATNSSLAARSFRPTSGERTI
jgi:hypothetical protein